MRRIDADHLKETLKTLKAEGSNQKYVQGLQDAIDGYFPQIIDDEPTVGQSHEEFAAKLTEKINGEYQKAKFDVKYLYDDQYTAQDALEDAHNHVLICINEILIEFLQEEKRMIENEKT